MCPKLDSDLTLKVPGAFPLLPPLCIPQSGCKAKYAHKVFYLHWYEKYSNNCFFIQNTKTLLNLAPKKGCHTLVFLIHVLSWISVLEGNLSKINKRPGLNKCPGKTFCQFWIVNSSFLHLFQPNWLVFFTIWFESVKFFKN